jgi:hypothetical protein
VNEMTENENFGPTTITIKYCENCNRNRAPRGKAFCIECQKRELEMALMTRDDSQRRAEYQRPEGHTLPNITVPLMGKSLPVTPELPTVPIRPTITTTSSPNEKLDELRRKIDELKKQVSQ